MRRLRGLLIALAVLAISAGAVLAGRVIPQAAGDGLAGAGEASGQTVPVGPDVQPTVDEPDEDTTETEDTTENEDTNAEHPDNHGAIVSEAAQGETPDGWKNHGEYVSAVARGLVQPGQAKPAAEPTTTTLKIKPAKPVTPAAGHKPDKTATVGH